MLLKAVEFGSLKQKIMFILMESVIDELLDTETESGQKIKITFEVLQIKHIIQGRNGEEYCRKTQKMQ